MCKFDYMNFNDGSSDVEFVVHASKYTKLEAIELCVQENDWQFMEKYCDGTLIRKPTVEDIKERIVRYYVSVPDYCGYDREGVCYTYCKRNERGSFPVWVIIFDNLVTV